MINFLRFHWLFAWVRSKARKNAITEAERFFREAVFKMQKPSLVFDVGASVGDLTEVFARLADHVICIEPDADNQKILSWRFGITRRITRIAVALADVEGMATFHVTKAGSPVNTLSQKWVSVLGDVHASRFSNYPVFSQRVQVPTMRLDTLIGKFGRPNYIKIDVEGSEKEVVQGLCAPVPIVSFECNLPEFEVETIWIIDYLITLDPRYRFNITQHYKFLLPYPVSRDEIVRLVTSRSYRYFDLFAFITCREQDHTV